MNSFLKIIDKNKRALAIILSIIAGVAALPFIMSGNMDEIVIPAFLLIMWLVVTFFLYIKGVPFAAMILTYILFMAIAVAVSILLQLLISLPEYIDENIFGSLATCVLVFFAFGVNVPVKIKNRLEKALYPEKLEENNDENIIGKKYQQYLTEKGIIDYLARPYSLYNISAIMKIIRLVLGVILVVSGLVALLISFYIKEEAANALTSYAFRICMGSLIALLFGGLLIVVGFIRAFISTAFAAGVVTFIVWIGFQLADVFKQSLLRFIVLLFLIIIFAVLIIIVVYRIYRRRTVILNFSNYEKDQISLEVDLAIKELLPIDGYTKLIRCIATFEPQIRDKAINEIVVKLTACACKKKLIFCGYTIESQDIKTLFLTFYVYANMDCSDILRKALSGFGCKSLIVDCSEDIEWSVYCDKLYPDQYTLKVIDNQNLNDYLELNGYDFSEPISLVYTLIFSFDHDAHDCVAKATTEGYIRAQYQSNVDYVSENELSVKYSHVVFIQNECMAGLEQLNSQTRKIMSFAERFNGELYEIDPGELVIQVNIDQTDL